MALARQDWQDKARLEVVGLPANLDGYDESYLGYPNYCGTMPMAGNPARVVKVLDREIFRIKGA